jgi:hypothetical protein
LAVLYDREVEKKAISLSGEEPLENTNIISWVEFETSHFLLYLIFATLFLINTYSTGL